MARPTTRPVVRQCREYEYVPIDRDDVFNEDGFLEVYPSVQKLNAFTIDFHGGKLRLQAGGFVGVVPVNDRLVLRITPRMPIANLTRMVERSGYEALPIEALRSYAPSRDVSDWLLDLYADELIRLAATVTHMGLYRTYTRETDTGSRPRGRIEMRATINRFAARGVHNKAQFSWFERSTDNPPNRCLKAALLLLLRRYSGPRHGLAGSRSRVRQLATILYSFSDVGEDPLRQFLSDPTVSGLVPPPAARTYYREPLGLAAAIVLNRGVSLDQVTGNVQLPSLLLNMGELFETYVRTMLQNHALGNRWPVEVLDGNIDGYLPLYEAPEPPVHVNERELFPLVDRTKNPPRVTPDILMRRADQSIAFVGELKNTVSAELPARSEVEQAVTYALRYGTTVTLLIHPKKRGEQGGLHLVGQVGSVRVMDYRYDLAASDMDAEDQAFARSVSALLTLTANATSASQAHP